jgi:hypothetical protein
MYDLNALEKIGEGRLSDVYKLDGGKMLKVFKQPGIAQYEFRQTNAVWQAGVSRQRPHEIVDVNGNEAIVYDYLDGEVLMNRINGDKRHVFRYLKRMAACHAAIGKGVCDELRSAKGGLDYDIGNAPFLSEKQKDCLKKGLASMPDGNHILHGDLHPLNIIINGDDLFAIDWMTGSKGDPAADIARSYFIIRYSVMRDDKNFIGYLQRSLLSSLLGRAYLGGVLKHSGLKWRQVKRWLPFIAAARLREQRPKTEVAEIFRIVDRFCGAAR